MSTLPGNPMGEKYGDSTGLSAEVVSALIVAHEIRTANLIAFVADIDDTSAMIPVVNEIKARLGLGAR